MSEYKCEVCGKPLEYSGRGRPPKLCAEHKAAKKEETTSKESTPRPRPRPAPTPSSKSESNGEPAQEEEPKRNTEGLRSRPTPIAKPDTQSRSKAESAAERTSAHTENHINENWPTGINGRPMARVSMTASELIPTGNYANVSIGPAQIHAFVDLDRDVPDESSYFTESERGILVKAMNELAEVVEHDVIGTQRNLVLESLQEQQASNGN